MEITKVSKYSWGALLETIWETDQDYWEISIDIKEEEEKRLNYDTFYLDSDESSSFLSYNSRIFHSGAESPNVSRNPS